MWHSWTIWNTRPLEDTQAAEIARLRATVQRLADAGYALSAWHRVNGFTTNGSYEQMREALIEFSQKKEAHDATI